MLEGYDENFWRTYLGISTPKIPREHVPICCTINFSPKTKLNSKQIWGELRPIEQYRYLKDYIRNNIYTKVDTCLFGFELCKSGEVHAHGLLIIKDDPSRSHYWVSDLQKQVLQDPRARKLARNNKNLLIRSHYIHKCDDVEAWLKYIMKELGLSPLIPVGYMIAKDAMVIESLNQ